MRVRYAIKVHDSNLTLIEVMHHNKFKTNLDSFKNKFIL